MEIHLLREIFENYNNCLKFFNYILFVRFSVHSFGGRFIFEDSNKEDVLTDVPKPSQLLPDYIKKCC